MDELEGLRSKVKSLAAELEENNKNLHLAGEIGNQLLAENRKLTEQLEDVHSQHTSRLEELEQEKYGLQNRLDSAMQMHSNYTEEIESLQSELAKEKIRHQEFVEMEHTSVISALKKQIGEMESSADRSRLLEQQLQQEVDQLSETIKQLQNELSEKANQMNETCSMEIAQLNSENEGLKADKLQLTRDMTSVRNQVEQLKLELNTTLQALVARDQEIEKKDCQATSYINALERSRQEIQELKTELDAMHLENQDTKTKGNSLFAEVEDRRIQAEKQLISLKVKYDELKKQYLLVRQHFHELKLKMGAFLQSSKGQADTERIEVLQTQLSKARNQLKESNDKLLDKEKEITKLRELAEIHQETTSGDTTASNFYRSLLASKNEEIEKVSKELRQTRLQHMMESDKVIQYDRKFYKMEKELETLRSGLLNSKLRVEELQLKYEPQSMKEKSKRIVRWEKIPLGPQENMNVDSTNSSIETQKDGEAPPKKPRVTDGKEQASAQEEESMKEKSKRKVLLEKIPICPQENKNVDSTKNGSVESQKEGETPSKKPREADEKEQASTQDEVSTPSKDRLNDSSLVAGGDIVTRTTASAPQNSSKKETLKCSVTSTHKSRSSHRQQAPGAKKNEQDCKVQ